MLRMDQVQWGADEGRRRMSGASFRKTEQAPLPARAPEGAPGRYELYPAFATGAGRIELGFDALARRMAAAGRVMLDGYGGVLWEEFRGHLDAALKRLGVAAAWQDVEAALWPEERIARLIGPSLGGDDPLFGTRWHGQLADFFDARELARLRPREAAELNIVYGCGAALADWDAPIFYVDLPKNEIQFRARAGSIHNLGARQAADAKAMYKRFYFVDWIALNRHKQALWPGLARVIDEQRPDQPASMSGEDLRAALDEMSKNYFRARPWFEPGAWGGQWLKRQIPELPQDAPNYAWSFELIAPENGLLLESAGNLIEVSLDSLLFQAGRAVVGECADLFGVEFPIRFDYLDTFEGGNLSLQCHPRLSYIRQEFGEAITQDEAYYILDCQPGAQVYLGLQADADAGAFRESLERSAQTGAAVEVEKFVHRETAHRHDLFLIPNGTVHGAGANNLVLEISARPYIFTFKIYDWLRRDLDGRPRVLNIGRGLENLDWTRRGARIRAELVARPRVLETYANGQLVHLPTHAEHFYDVHRLEFGDTVEVSTNGSCHVLNVVEGEGVILETQNGQSRGFHFAETFVIPAAAERYRLTNVGRHPARVVKAFLKPRPVVERILGADG